MEAITDKKLRDYCQWYGRYFSETTKNITHLAISMCGHYHIRMPEAQRLIDKCIRNGYIAVKGNNVEVIKHI